MNANRYSSLSKDELYLISRAEYERQTLITSNFANLLFNSPKRTAAILGRLTRKGRFVQLQRGKYLVVPIKAPNQQWAPNEFVVAALWMGDTPYYIGYFTMYNYWGFTEQIPQTVFVLNLKKNIKKTIGSLRLNLPCSLRQRVCFFMGLISTLSVPVIGTGKVTSKSPNCLPRG